MSEPANTRKTTDIRYLRRPRLSIIHVPVSSFNIWYR